MALGVVLIAAACGGGSSTTTAGASNTTGGDQQASRQAYTDCMAQNGVNLPARGQGNGNNGQGNGGGQGNFDPNAAPGAGGGPRGTLPPGVDQATMDKARAACQSLRPQGGFGGGGSAFQAYASCMKDHGITLPARGNGSTDTSTPPSTIDRTSAAFQTANNACKALLPTQGGQNGSSTSTTAAP